MNINKKEVNNGIIWKYNAFSDKLIYLLNVIY